jgi:putative ABC transport system permease protein
MAWDRKGEWGLYLALGATRRDLKIFVIGEALILSMGGVLAGIVLGYGLYYAILALLNNRKAFPFIEASFSAQLLGVIGAMAIFSFIGIISAWFPANRSARIEPSAAMALEDID